MDEVLADIAKRRREAKDAGDIALARVLDRAARILRTIQQRHAKTS